MSTFWKIILIQELKMKIFRIYQITKLECPRNLLILGKKNWIHTVHINITRRKNSCMSKGLLCLIKKGCFILMSIFYTGSFIRKSF